MISKDYLTNLQEQYGQYIMHLNDLLKFLHENMGGTIENIAFDTDNTVIVETLEMCRGTHYNETYRIPFEYFENAENFRKSYNKFRD